MVSKTSLILYRALNLRLRVVLIFLHSGSIQWLTGFMPPGRPSTWANPRGAFERTDIHDLSNRLLHLRFPVLCHSASWSDSYLKFLSIWVLAIFTHLILRWYGIHVSCVPVAFFPASLIHFYVILQCVLLCKTPGLSIPVAVAMLLCSVKALREKLAATGWYGFLDWNGYGLGARKWFSWRNCCEHFKIIRFISGAEMTTAGLLFGIFTTSFTVWITATRSASFENSKSLVATLVIALCG